MSTALSYPLVPTGKPVIALLVAILVEGLMLDQTKPQLVIYNQQWRMPTDPGLHMHLAVLAPKPFAFQRTYQTGADGCLEENVSGNKVETYELNLYSKDLSALDARDLPGVALMSTFSEQVQEANDFQIARIPVAYVDTSEQDGEGILTRYTYTFNVTSGFSRIRPVAEYDKFSRAVLVTQP